MERFRASYCANSSSKKKEAVCCLKNLIKLQLSFGANVIDNNEIFSYGGEKMNSEIRKIQGVYTCPVECESSPGLGDEREAEK